MKRLFVLLLTLGILHSFAQDSNKKATEILDAVVEKTNSLENFKVDFIYSMINEEAGIDESKEGVIYVDGDKYRLNIAGQIVICDGETVWTYLPEDFEVMLNMVEESDESITLSNLLNQYNEKYKSKYLGENTIQGTSYLILELKPKEGKTYTKVEIVVEKETMLINSFTIFDKNGSVYAYQIEKFESDLPISDTMFVFSPAKHPDVEIIDMR